MKLNEDLIKKYADYEEKSNELDAMDDVVCEFRDALHEASRKVFIDDGLLAGDWEISTDTRQIILKPQTLKHKDILNKYRELSHKYHYAQTAYCAISDNIKIDVHLNAYFKITIPLYHLTTDILVDFLNKSKINIVEFNDIEYGLDLEEAIKMRNKILELVEK